MPYERWLREGLEIAAPKGPELGLDAAAVRSVERRFRDGQHSTRWLCLLALSRWAERERMGTRHLATRDEVPERGSSKPDPQGTEATVRNEGDVRLDNAVERRWNWSRPRWSFYPLDIPVVHAGRTPRTKHLATSTPLGSGGPGR